MRPHDRFESSVKRIALKDETFLFFDYSVL